MSLQDQINADLITAMKAKETDRRGVLRMLKSGLKNASIEKGGADAVLEDSEAQIVIRKQAKQRQDSIEGFEKGHRPELAAREKMELEILNAYLPKELSESELSKLVRTSIEEVGANSKAQMGAVMKVAQAKAG